MPQRVRMGNLLEVLPSTLKDYIWAALVFGATYFWNRYQNKKQNLVTLDKESFKAFQCDVSKIHNFPICLDETDFSLPFSSKPFSSLSNALQKYIVDPNYMFVDKEIKRRLLRLSGELEILLGEIATRTFPRGNEQTVKRKKYMDEVDDFETARLLGVQCGKLKQCYDDFVLCCRKHT